MAFQADNDLDLLTTTLAELGEYHWTDAISAIQEYVVISRLMKKHKLGFEAGPDIKFNIQVTPTASFNMVGIGAPDQINITDTMTTGSIPWRHSNTNWGVDGRELAMNREPRRIVELVKTRRSAAMVATAAGWESQFWNMPSGSTDTINVFGLPYWMVPNATQGFNGGNPFNFSAGAAGLSSTTYPNWANYTDQYADMTKLDLIRKWRRAAYFTKFISPVNADIPQYNTGDKLEYWTTYIVLQRCQEAAEQQNDNLGNDIAPMDGGGVVFRRNPIGWAPQLESLSGTGMSGTFSNSTYTSTGGYAVNPVFGINWGVMQICFLEGWYMREHGPFPLNGIQHTVYGTHVDTTANLICRDRRRLFVLTQ